MSVTILALDASTDACSVALLRHDKITQDYRVAPQQHAKLLLSMIDELLAGEDYDLLAFSHGPGSFTGLRITSSLVQGLALAHQKPVVGISTCHALAQAAFREGGHEHVVSMLDARMGEVYWGVYVCENGVVRNQVPDRVSDAEEIAGMQERPNTVIGTGTESVACLFANQYPNYFPQAADIATLASHVAPCDYLTVEQAQPVYLRNNVTQPGKK